MEKASSKGIADEHYVSAKMTLTTDEQLLSDLGYKQELKRGLSLLTNFGVSFCILSFPTGVVGSFATAWFWGGPVTAVWGWLLITLMICGFVGPAMAEICSSYPTSGGLYYWAAKLGGKHGVFASWLTGWFNLLGQIAISSSVAMASTNSIIILAVMASCPSRLNRHNGLSLPTFTSVNSGGLAYLSDNTVGSPKNEPCPVDINGYVLTSKLAYVDTETQQTWYYPNNTLGFSGFATDAFGTNHTTVAYNDAECLRQPFNPTQPVVYGIFCCVMATMGLINCMSINLMDSLVKCSIFFHIFGSLVIIIGLPIAAKVHLNTETIWLRFQPSNWGAMYDHGISHGPPGSTIFTGYMANNNMNYGGNGISATDHAHADPGMFHQAMVTDSTAATQHSNYLHEKNPYQAQPMSTANPYIFFCGMLMSQWSFTGYDASAHMVEETQNAAVAGPQGLFRALTINAAFGFAFIIAIISSIPNYMNTFFGPLALNYNPVAQIFFDVFEERTGNGRNGCGFWMLIMVCMYLCGVSCLTSNARMLYAFARDGAVPGSSFWHTVNKQVGIPTNAVIGMTFAAIIIAAPVTYSTTAYSAVTSITTIGLYISYVVPMFCRVTVGRKDFVPGPFYLGHNLSIFVHTVSCCWVTLICVIFVLPNTYPISMKLNFNYAIIAVGIVVVYSLGTWFIPGPRPLNARVWFKGPNIKSLNFEVVADGGPGASMRGVHGDADLPPVPLGV